MSLNSTTGHATGNLALRVVIWLLAVAGTLVAVVSIDRVLRNRSAEGVATPVILPSSPGGEKRSAAKTVESATKNLADLTGVLGDDSRRDGIKRDDTRRDDPGIPAFDIARVEPSGDTVIAGRATPGAAVELLRNGKVYDRVVADPSGQFVIVPPRLPVGESELTLRSRPPNGAMATSTQTVVVAVEPNLKTQPVVALMAPDKPSVVLSKPPAPDASAAGSIVVETVEAEAGGKLYVSGHSAPGALVRLYLNDSYHSTVTADASGRVAFTAGNALTGDDAGRGSDYRVRLDEVDRASGVIKSRAEVPFTPPPNAFATAAVASRSAHANAGASGAGALAAAAVPRTQKGQEKSQEKGQITVSRGDSLWRISRLAYGDGARYTVIYDANHKQIQNPNRIYPGQVFIIPDGKGD